LRLEWAKLQNWGTLEGTVIKTFTIKNLRCFDNLTIGPFEQINLIAGKNNVGKTALLEALWLHHGYHNPQLGIRVNMLRGLGNFKTNELLWDLFAGFDHQKKIELSSVDDGNQSKSLCITTQKRSTTSISLADETKTKNGYELATLDTSQPETTKSGDSEILWEYNDSFGKTVLSRIFVEQNEIKVDQPFNNKLPSGVFLIARRVAPSEILAERWSNVTLVKQEENMIRTLRIIEPRLKNLALHYQAGKLIIYGDVGLESLLPLALMGDGIRRLLEIALAMAQAQDGILLIDEIDNGLHYTVQTKVWNAIAELAKLYNVQVFATTHSYECVQYAHQAFKERKGYPFHLHRLEDIKGTIGAVTYDKEMLEAALDEGWEIR